MKSEKLLAFTFRWKQHVSKVSNSSLGARGLVLGWALSLCVMQTAFFHLKLNHIGKIIPFLETIVGYGEKHEVSPWMRFGTAGMWG